MSELFGVSVDYILKGGAPAGTQIGSNNKLVSQIISAVAAMLFIVAIFVSRLIDGADWDIAGGFVIESVGLMLLLIGIFFSGGRKLLNKPLFTVNILLAGVLPTALVINIFFRYYPRPMELLSPLPVLLFAGVYLVLCGAVILPVLLVKKK